MSQIFSAQRNPRLEAFRVVPASCPTGTAAQSTTGVLDGAFRCTVLRNGTGDVTLTFNRPFARTPSVTASALHASNKVFAMLKSVSSTAVNLLVFTDAGSASDPTELHVQVLGFDSADQVG